MNSNDLAPVMAGIVMAVAGVALAAALGRSIVRAVGRRSWPVVPGRVQVKSDAAGHRNALAVVHYEAGGRRRSLQVPTGGFATSGKDGQVIDLCVDPKDPDNAVPRSAPSHLAAFGCFGVVALFFAVFGIVAVITVLTN